MSAHPRFRAPRQHGEFLAVPALDAVPGLVEGNRKQLDTARIAIDGLSLVDFRSRARDEILPLCAGSYGEPVGSLDAPLMLSGHQPELSHPGVWVKNFALHGLAARLGGTALNLIVDNDTLKSTSLRLPAFRDAEPTSVHLQALAFDDFCGERAYEDIPYRNAELFRSFPARAAEITRNWGYDPLLPKVWRQDRTLDRAFVGMRRDCERAWGCRNRELRVSYLSRTEAFARFARHILGDLARFRQVYNAALRDYRRDNGIRSQSHPAPDLGPDEAPFWVQTEGLRTRATTHSDPRSLHPRALTLTLFARVCLGDFFIHGIGGGKYDEVTDRIIHDYLGLDPPAYQVLSATLLLPLPTFPATPGDRVRAERFARDLHWNPQRFIPADRASDPVVQKLLLRKQELIGSAPPAGDHASRRKWFQALQEVTDRLRPHAASRLGNAQQALRRIRDELDANEILRRRDYAWVFYPEEVLRPFLQGFLG